MSSLSNPSLSVVVIDLDAALLARCLSSLDRQTVQEGVEIIVVSRQGMRTEEPGAAYRQIRWINAPPHYNVPQMRSLGMAGCRGEIVALLEDDCEAADDWCAALQAAHRSAATAVGGSVKPGPYTRLLDWAYYLSEYGRFMPPLPPGPTSVLPGTNVSYKRSALFTALDIAEDDIEQSFGDGFYETFIHQRLLRAGHELLAEPSAIVYHVKSWKSAEIITDRYHHGRGYAGKRAAGLPGLKRVPYILLAVILPVILIGRMIRQSLSRRNYLGKLVWALPWIAVIASSWSVGELIGYASGPGDSLSRWQ
jgi:GT2 family glycosyltransferase